MFLLETTNFGLSFPQPCSVHSVWKVLDPPARERASLPLRPVRSRSESAGHRRVRERLESSSVAKPLEADECSPLPADHVLLASGESSAEDSPEQRATPPVIRLRPKSLPTSLAPRDAGTHGIRRATTGCNQVPHERCVRPRVRECRAGTIAHAGRALARGHDRSGHRARTTDATIGGRLRRPVAVLGILGQAFPGITLAGVDIEERQLESARAHLSELGLTADLRRADALELPYEGASFDHTG